MTGHCATEADGQPPHSRAPAWHIDAVLRLADDALILSQRLGEWAGHGPILEEDLAMANIGLDLIGQARMLLTHAGKLENAGRDEDQFAYFRDSAQFRNHALVELPSGTGKHDDYAIAIVRNFLFSAYTVPMLQSLATSTDPDLRQIAAKAVKEAKGHLRHSRDWVIRFGDGTDESHQRAQHALEWLWPYTGEFWRDDDVDRAAAAAGVAPLPSSLRSAWNDEVDAVLGQATLRRPADSEFMSHGKSGRHTEHLDYLLAEMQSIARAHPGASW